MTFAVLVDSLGRVFGEWEAETDHDLGAMIASALLAGDDIEIDYTPGDTVVMGG